MKCKNCDNPAAPQQVYCSRTCAPYGYLVRSQRVPAEPNARRRANAAKHLEVLQKCSEAGMTASEAARSSGLHPEQVRVYGRDLGLKFKPYDFSRRS